MNIKITTLLLGICIGCNPGPKKETNNLVKEELIIKEFQHQLQKDLEDDNINGSISAAIVKGDKVIWSQAFGYKNGDTKEKSDTNTIYRVGSITKTFTAFLMMQLAEEGIIALDEPIAKYVPEVLNINGYTAQTTFTFEQLASHTSGLNREPDLEGANSGPFEEWEARLLESLPHTSFQRDHDGTYSYSNIGYAILGLALSRAANVSYTELGKQKIFEPLEMCNTFFKVPESKKSQLAVGMQGGPFGELSKETPEEEHSGRGYKVPNGAIYSTPNDMAKFMSAVRGYSDLVTSESIKSMLRPPKTDEEGWWQSYGKGLRLLRDSVISTAGHSGMVSGYTANFMYQREGDYGVITMRNYNWGMTNMDLRSFAVLRRLKNLNPTNQN